MTSVSSKSSRALALCTPGVAWILIFLLLPFLSILTISFLTRGSYGEMELPFTTAHYAKVIGSGSFGFDPVYLKIIGRSVLMGCGTLLFSIGLSLPIAFFIAGLPKRWKDLGLILIVIPFWSNLLIRTYAWEILLAPEGVVSRVLRALHLLTQDEGLYPGPIAVYIGMVCDYLPYAALPIYASVEKMNWRLVEAAMDLGASPLKSFFHAVIPQIRPGMIAAGVVVLIPATGQYVIPDLLAGGKTATLGTTIGQQFGASRNWPFGSAIACVMMVLVMIALWLYARGAAAKGEDTLL